MLVTGHWSATAPARLRDYHIEFSQTSPIDSAFKLALRDAIALGPPDFAKLRESFTIWKNDQLGSPTDYGTWHLNHDPRDGSANIEIGALCMANATTQNWGRYPFTRAHAWMMAGIVARVCVLKKIDTGGSFATDVEPSVLQNGPIFNVSTHGERALQTQNPGTPENPIPHPERGYFIYSGDPDCRWDLAVLDPSDVGKISVPSSAIAAATASAAWIRMHAHAIAAAGITDFWGLDGPATP